MSPYALDLADQINRNVLFAVPAGVALVFAIGALWRSGQYVEAPVGVEALADTHTDDVLAKRWKATAGFAFGTAIALGLLGLLDFVFEARMSNGIDAAVNHNNHWPASIYATGIGALVTSVLLTGAAVYFLVRFIKKNNVLGSLSMGVVTLMAAIVVNDTVWNLNFMATPVSLSPNPLNPQIDIIGDISDYADLVLTGALTIMVITLFIFTVKTIVEWHNSRYVDTEGGAIDPGTAKLAGIRAAERADELTGP